MLTPLWLTLKVALLATLLAGVAGITLGWWMARRRFAGHAVVDSFLMLPMVLPPTVLGYYLIVVVGAVKAIRVLSRSMRASVRYTKPASTSPRAT